MKVFLDANILFSASEAGSATRMLLDRVTENGKAVTSPHTWEEARRNLERKRPHLLAGLDAIRRFVTVTHAFSLPTDVEVADKDKPVLAGAMGSGCTHLWTSDRRHFGPLYGKTIHDVKITSSIQLVAMLEVRL